jgi:hypothetical protein
MVAASDGGRSEQGMIDIICTDWVTYLYLLWLLTVIIVNVWLRLPAGRRPR